MPVPHPAAALRVGFVLTLAGCTLALAACGGGESGGGANASGSDSDQETAQLRLQDCLRKQGVEIPDRPASGQRPRDAGPPSAGVEQKMRRAMEGPCKKYREKAFGNVSAEDRQEMEDRQVKFTSCMRKHGVDIEHRTADGGRRSTINLDNPKTKKAMEACRKLAPRPPGGPGKGGRGGGFMIGPGPGPGQ